MKSTYSNFQTQVLNNALDTVLIEATVTLLICTQQTSVVYLERAI